MGIGTAAIEAGRAYVRLYTDSSEYVKGLRSAEGRLKDFGNKVGTIGARLAGIATAAAAPIVFSARTFAAFEDQMLAVKAAIEGTEEEYQRLYDQAKKLGATTSFKASEVAGGQYELATQGFKAPEIEAAIPSVLNLARATRTDLATAAEIASGTLRDFGLEAGQMPRVADVLVATANASSVSLTDLGESMSYAGPVAKQYGLSIEQTAKTLGVLGNMQIKGTMAGTALRQIMLQLADTKVQDQLRELGVETVDAAGNMRPLGDVMIEIGKAMAGMGQADRLSMMKDLFDQRAVTASLSLSAGGFEELSAAIDNSAGVAERTARAMDSGLGGVFRILMSAVEGLQIAIGEALAETLTDWGTSVTEVAEQTRAWIKEHENLVIAFTMAVAAIGAASVALITFGATANGVSAAIGATTLAIKGLSAATAFLAANPAVIAMATLAASLTAVSYIMDEFIKSSIIAAHGLERFGLLKIAPPDLDKLETGDQLRNEDMRLIQRLEELAKKTALTNEEIDEASTIIAALDSRHAGLGVTLNKTTGAIAGVEQAYASLTASMQRNAERELLAAAKEQLTIAQTMAEAIADVRDSWMKKSERESMIAELTTEMEVATVKANALQARLRDLKQGNLAGALGETPEAAAAAARPPVEQERMMTPEEESAHEKRIQQRRDIKGLEIDLSNLDEFEQRKKRLELQRDAELREAPKSGEDPDLIRQKYELELKKLELDRQRANRSVEDEIARQEIENRWGAQLPGDSANERWRNEQRDKALLEQERQNALRDAKVTGQDPAQVNKLYDSKLAALEMQARSHAFEGLDLTASTYSAQEAFRLGQGGKSNTAEDKTAAGVEKLVKIGQGQADDTKQLRQAVQRGGRMGP